MINSNSQINCNPFLLRSRSGSVETFFTLFIIFVKVDFSFMWHWRPTWRWRGWTWVNASFWAISRIKFTLHRLYKNSLLWLWLRTERLTVILKYCKFFIISKIFSYLSREAGSVLKLKMMRLSWPRRVWIDWSTQSAITIICSSRSASSSAAGSSASRLASTKSQFIETAQQRLTKKLICNIF